jgi:WD domain, G-beta repeat.
MTLNLLCLLALLKMLDMLLFIVMVILNIFNLKHKDTKKTISFKAHQSQIGCMELDFQGKKLATASEKVGNSETNVQFQGTLIRIFNTEDGTLIHELRRGSEYAQIFSIAFDKHSKWLATASDTCTIHIFSLQGKE